MIAINTNIMAPGLAEEAHWQKSSYSTQEGGSCVELARHTRVHGRVGVRDSKEKAGPALAFTPEAWSSFVNLVSGPEARA